MNNGPFGSDVDQDAETHHHALIGLHQLAGTFDDIDLGTVPGLRPLPPATALRTVAGAPKDQIPESARLSLLYDLARADFPHFDSSEAEYRLLAESVTQERGLDADQLLTDLKESAREEVPFSSTDTGRQLPHHLVAFVGEEVCTVQTVRVGDLTGTWIFSEFDTDASFDNVADWVDPRNWPERGPMLFKQMSIVGSPGPLDISSLGDDHWHAVFHEEVQLVTRVNTLLHCDFWREGAAAAGMTYELDFSLDNALDVDRGFLSVNDLGPVRRVKALKIVGFTDDRWDRVARLVCPFWTDWVRAAAEGGTTSTPRPTPGGTGPGPGSVPGGEIFDAWVDFFGDSAREYFNLFGEATTKAVSGQYSSADWVADGRRYWSQLAKDWAQAWTIGFELLQGVARDGLDAGIMPPGSPPAAGGVATAMTTAGAQPGSESTFVPLPGLTEADRPVCTPLASIEAGGPAIAPNDISVTLERLADGTQGVRLSTTTSVPSGLYVGDLENAQGQKIAPVQIYVSQATGTR